MNLKAEMRGTGQVFRFTFLQLLKSKGNIIGMVFTLILAMASMPLMAFLGGGSFVSDEDSSLKALYVDNRTALSLSFSDLSSYLYESAAFPGLALIEGSLPEEAPEAVGAVVSEDEDGIALTFTWNDSKGVQPYAVYQLSALLQPYIEKKSLEALGLPERAVSLLSGSHVVQAMPLAGYDAEGTAEESEDNSFDEDGYTTQMGYSIILMMFCIYSISFIIRAIIEEKSSKLVDTLLISVRPAALLFGKVLAVLAYVVIYMGILIGGMALSYAVTSRFLDVSAMSGILGAILSLKLDGMGILVVVVTSLLGYLGFGLLAGLCGAGCSSMDDASGAMSTCMILIIAGYMVSIMGFFSSGTLRTVGCLLPVLSMFMAPMNYLSGNIGFGLVAASWGIQLLVILLLILMSARLYSRLIIYNGQRLKFFDILKMARGRGAA